MGSINHGKWCRKVILIQLGHTLLEAGATLAGCMLSDISTVAKLPIATNDE